MVDVPEVIPTISLKYGYQDIWSKSLWYLAFMKCVRDNLKISKPTVCRDKGWKHYDFVFRPVLCVIHTCLCACGLEIGISQDGCISVCNQCLFYKRFTGWQTLAATVFYYVISGNVVVCSPIVSGELIPPLWGLNRMVVFTELQVSGRKTSKRSRVVSEIRLAGSFLTAQNLCKSHQSRLLG